MLKRISRSRLKRNKYATPKEAAKAIKNLEIQGANDVAIYGAYSLLGSRNLKADIRLLTEARPTEPFLRNALRYISKTKGPLEDKVEYIRKYFSEAKEKIAEYGVRKIKHRNHVFTHCHSSTVTNLLIKAKSRRITVHNTETRPFFQGRITAKELAKEGIKVEHYIDSAARLALKKSDIALFGCDAITSDGFIINKIGSEMFAEVASSIGVPIFICTLSWKYDARTMFGFDEKIEQRFKSEVWKRPPKNVKVHNAVFERIHPRLITGIISEFGILTVNGFLEEVRQEYPWMI